MALTQGSKFFLSAAAVGVGAYTLYRMSMRPAAATESNQKRRIVTRYDVDPADEAVTAKGTTMTPQWSKGSAYGDVGAFSSASGGQDESNATRDALRAAERSSTGLVGTTDDYQERDAATEYVRQRVFGDRPGSIPTSGSSRYDYENYGMRPTSGRGGQVDRTDIAREHMKGAARDASKTSSEVGGVLQAHGELASRDTRTMREELSDAFTAPTLRGGVTVRDPPNMVTEGARDRTRVEPTHASNNPAAARAPNVIDRVKEAADVVGAHTRAAYEDAKQVGEEVMDTMRGHSELASRDMAHARKEMNDVAAGQRKTTVEVRDAAMGGANPDAKDRIARVDKSGDKKLL